MTRYRNRPFPVPRSGSGFLHITPTAEVDFSNRRQLNVTVIKEGACFTSLAERNLVIGGSSVSLIKHLYQILNGRHQTLGSVGSAC